MHDIISDCNLQICDFNWSDPSNEKMDMAKLGVLQNATISLESRHMHDTCIYVRYHKSMFQHAEPAIPICWWLKSRTAWDVWNPINNGKNYSSTGAGFQPSTVLSHFFRIPETIAKCLKKPFRSIHVHQLAGARWNFTRKPCFHP